MRHNLQKGRLVQGSERLRSFFNATWILLVRRLTHNTLLSPFIYIFHIKAASEASITD